ncbi:MAG: formylglycine-generating enzyme family protein [Kiritimatiellae bacterium]|nr:formylglycine-generating enzyme family protein [Kiritimatiellia bacterium]
MSMSKMITFAAVAASAMAANAASITIDSVRQRWPWNNKVDITYTISGGQNVAAGVFAKLVFTATIAGQTYTIDGVHDIGASASDGTHTVTWTPPADIRARATDCTMTATLSAADNPSGDDYMVVDLASGVIAWEGLLATQNASNERYNTAVYKTDKLVLRKVPAGGPYPTGDDANYASVNARKMWTTAKDYYIGVFPVTQYQYTKLYGSNPSGRTTPIAGNEVEVTYRPVEQVSWDDLRLSTTASTSPIPAVASPNSGTFFQRLNYITGNKYRFDLPTEVMFEIAERAGATTAFYWGNTIDTSYIVCQDNSYDNTINKNNTVAVGSRLPNAWGLYDMAGNVWELCLDDVESGNLTARTDAFTPAWASGISRRLRGGGMWNNKSSDDYYFHASYRFEIKSSERSVIHGFRVALTAD